MFTETAKEVKSKEALHLPITYCTLESYLVIEWNFFEFGFPIPVLSLTKTALLGLKVSLLLHIW